MNSQQLADAFKAACMAELEALKPGNVHIFADGHGMTVQDFIISAEAASAVIAQPNLSLGARILQSVQATHDAVQTNTNLGMILLGAPIQLKMRKRVLQQFVWRIQLVWVIARNTMCSKKQIAPCCKPCSKRRRAI
jgi:triphosphoribosyl-dephospho-CoA synthetase